MRIGSRVSQLQCDNEICLLIRCELESAVGNLEEMKKVREIRIRGREEKTKREMKIERKVRISSGFSHASTSKF